MILRHSGLWIDSCNFTFANRLYGCYDVWYFPCCFLLIALGWFRQSLRGFCDQNNFANRNRARAECQSSHHICILALTSRCKSRVSGQSDLAVCATNVVSAGKWGFNRESGCDSSAASQRHVRWSSRSESRADCLVATAGFITSANSCPPATRLSGPPSPLQPPVVMSPVPTNHRARPRCKQKTSPPYANQVRDPVITVLTCR